MEFLRFFPEFSVQGRFIQMKTVLFGYDQVVVVKIPEKSSMTSGVSPRQPSLHIICEFSTNFHLVQTTIRHDISPRELSSFKPKVKRIGILKCVISFSPIATSSEKMAYKKSTIKLWRHKEMGSCHHDNITMMSWESWDCTKWRRMTS